MQPEAQKIISYGVAGEGGPDLHSATERNGLIIAREETRRKSSGNQPRGTRKNPPRQDKKKHEQYETEIIEKPTKTNMKKNI